MVRVMKVEILDVPIGAAQARVTLRALREVDEAVGDWAVRAGEDVERVDVVALTGAEVAGRFVCGEWLTLAEVDRRLTALTWTMQVVNVVAA